jgi:hypothetical protein
MYRVLGSRPVDSQWEKRPRNVWQQYELNVKRLDAEFSQRLTELHKQALASGKWKGTSAVHDPHAYWLTGTLAYFHACGQHNAPFGTDDPIVTRAGLQTYDPELYNLIHENFAYGGRIVWQFRP